MERPFLRFNDYLGLSSIFQQEQISCSNHTSSTTSVNTTSPGTFDEWLDRRLLEIEHQYTLKMALNHCDANKVQPTNAIVKGVSNTQSSFSSTFPRPSTGSLGLCQPNANKLSYQHCYSNQINSTCSTPSHASRINSLTNSPMSPHFNFDAQSPLLNTTSSSSAMLSPLANSSPAHFFASISSGSVTTASAPKNPTQKSPIVAENYASMLPRLTSQRQQHRSTVGCSFCRNNKEVEDWVMSHQLKDSLNRVTCPILRSYVCPLCYASGDNAHTLGHCPLNPDKRNCSLPLAVRRRTNATGRVKL